MVTFTAKEKEILIKNLFPQLLDGIALVLQERVEKTIQELKDYKKGDEIQIRLDCVINLRIEDLLNSDEQGSVRRLGLGKLYE